MENTNIKVAIVGTGVIGAGWATHFLAQGFEVMATDPAVGADARLREWVDGYWPTVVELGLVDGASRDKLSFTTDLAEAVPARRLHPGKRLRAGGCQNSRVAPSWFPLTSTVVASTVASGHRIDDGWNDDTTNPSFDSPSSKKVGCIFAMRETTHGH
jgi:3-hydroxyacyl-CoA dehydrogenase, NAD binding domain